MNEKEVKKHDVDERMSLLTMSMKSLYSLEVHKTSVLRTCLYCGML